MYLNKITISGFKNISATEISFSPKLNCITGMNGAGKTNLLDSIYFLSMTKSYFSGLDLNIIGYNIDLCSVAGEYIREDETTDLITFSLEKAGPKHFKRNLKKYSRLSDHIGVIPIVMVSPYDNCLINESGEERRKFMNSILSQLDNEYLRRVQNYNQLLAQRNRLLKSDNFSRDLLDTFSERLSWNATYIFEKRAEFVGKLFPIVNKYYNELSGQKESIEMEYRSHLKQGNLEELLKANIQKDCILKHTSVGIHRDDLVFNMNGHLFRICGSQGQQKTFLISLKLAQFEIMKQMHKRVPLLLLDDVFDKLDMNRVQSLLNMVSSNLFGQIFITDSNKVRVKEILAKINGSSSLFEIDSGTIK
ncbi:MAG: DNA replication and repair protein RecF [Bacteroidales bacterium]|nr:DNA replication and repair protein RecF [Bacteroidales bacterium]MDD4656345.1 DNA replication and repair protein RecF [Bacteroidales bacterium]